MTTTSQIEPTAVIARETQRLADLLSDCPPDAPVPTCPGWTAADLLWHLSTVHRFWGIVLREDPSSEQAESLAADQPEQPATVAEILPLRAQWTAELCSQLDALDDATPRWSWYAFDQSVGFTRRMQLSEATMHRVDAELTAGQPVTPMEPELARAVVRHAVEVMYDLAAFEAWLPTGGETTTHGVVALEADDSEDRWLAEVRSYTWTDGEGGSQVQWGLAVVEGVEADATVRGRLDELARWIWTRPGEVQTSGDAKTLDALLALHEAGIQ